MKRLAKGVGAQVFSLKPQGCVVIGLLGVFHIRHGAGLGEEIQIDTFTHCLIAFGIQVKPVVLEQEL